MSDHTTNVLHAEKLLKEAFKMDDKGLMTEAQNLYIEAVEFCLKCVSFCVNLFLL